jgi:hypothetical protein
MNSIINIVTQVFIAIILFIVNTAILDAFVKWAWSEPVVGSLGKVLIGIIALVFTVVEFIGIIRRFFSTGS